MRKIPLVAAFVTAVAVVAIDHESVGRAAAEVSVLVTQAAGPPVVRVEPAEVITSAETIEKAPPAQEPQALPAEEWGELDDEPAEDSDDGADEPEEVAPEGAPVLVSIARETWVYAEPRWRSRRLGYLRAGGKVTRSREPVAYGSCKHGWYRVEPQGYVCNNASATLDPAHPVAQLSARRPALEGLPYPYALSRFPTPPLYARLPTLAQQNRTEPERAYHLRKHERLKKEKDFTAAPEPDATPELLADNKLVPALGGVTRGSATVLLGHARVRSGFALLGTYVHEDRQFGLTTDMAIIPLDRTRIVRPSTLRGVSLSDELELPIGIVRSTFARRFVAQPTTNALAIGEPIAHRSVVGLTGKSRYGGGQSYLEMTDGSFVLADRVARVEPFTVAPKWAREGKKWIDISILRQTLVAYEGTRAVYATLVSTGAGGIADHKESHATIQGTFLIHTKHLTVTMDGDETGDEFDLRDVPFVQYFTEGYALHGAYWHDDFGLPRSHGCVNLAPIDAAWLFAWTEPEVPEGWHAALSLKKGTIVYIHP